MEASARHEIGSLNGNLTITKKICERWPNGPVGAMALTSGPVRS